MEIDKLSKWAGSLFFLKKYVSQALKRISAGPRSWQDPEAEFIAQDIDDYCKYKCKEVEDGQKYRCEICSKCFRGTDFVIKHIKNKHADKIDETYEKPSTKEWLKKTLYQKLRRQTK
jgi:hypothetical protein